MSLATDGMVSRALAVHAALEAKERDPLSFFRFAVPRIREAFALFAQPDPIDELALQGPNGTGKTLSKAMYVMACAQKRKTLDGIPIPQWRGRVECLQLVLDYPQQLLSVRPAYLRALGKWPAHVTNEGEYLKTIRVSHHGPTERQDETAWSVIHFLSQKNLDTGKGARADIIDFDEPAKMDFLRELRKAGHAGRRSIILHGFTPLKRKEWAPVRQDYGDTPRRSLVRIDRERAIVRWSLDEVASWVLSDEAKDKLRRKYSTDPQKLAREHGDYENVSGQCPFDSATILKMMDAWCVDPIIKHVPVQVEHADGRPSEIERIPVEVWTLPRRGLEAYQCIDPASGIDDNAHNPAGLHGSNDDTGDLLYRWNGYLAPYSVGALAAGLHRHYNRAATDIEMKDHWGVNVVRGYEDNDGTNLCFEQRELRPGVWAKETGFDANEEARRIWIGSIQEWIAAFKGGEPYAVCPSRAVFECLLDTELDDRSRIVAGPGIAHGEDMVLLGQKLRRIRRPIRETPQPYTPPPTPKEEREAHSSRIVSLIRGEDEDMPELERPEPPRW